MNVEFEVRRQQTIEEKAAVPANTIEDMPKGARPSEVIVDDIENLVETDSDNENVSTADEKARLQGILTDAGVEFSPKLGVAKLQKLVDELPATDTTPTAE